jgi:hypothetical protein
MKFNTLATCFVLLVATSGCTTDSLLTTPEANQDGSNVLAKSDNAATVFTKATLAAIGENWCAVWGSDGELYYDWNAKAIVNVQTRTGNEALTCRMEGVFNDTGNVLYWDADDFPGERDESDPGTYMTATFFGLTADWSVRLMPSGKAILQAHVNPRSDDYLSYEEYCQQYPTGAASWACG